jgi:outer membrane receptor protein involved in Fe transport
MDWAPELSGNIYLKYTFELGSGAVLEPRISWRYQDDVWTNFFQAPHHRIPGYSVGDFRLRYSPRTDFYIEGYIKNFTDKLDVVSSIGNYPGLIQFGAPRQIGITARYTF